MTDFPGSSFQSGEEDNDIGHVSEAEIGSNEEITRCVCGAQELEHGSSLMIQCEICSAWQHGPCVGILENGEVPESYYCEQCRPDLHEFGSRLHGSRQTLWIGSNSRPRRSSKRKVSPGPRKRSTMNSMSATDDFKGIFQQSEPPSKLNSPSSSSRHSQSDDRSRRSQNASEFKGRFGDASDSLLHQISSSTPPLTRGKSSAMIASVASKRKAGSNIEDDDDDDAAVDEKEVKDNDGQDTVQIGPSSHLNRRHENVVALDSTKLNKRPEGKSIQRNHRQLNRKAPSRPIKGNSHNLIVDAEGGGPNVMRTPTLRSQTPEKPARPRIPQNRATLAEMRKRVNAILEYVGRIQTELSRDAPFADIDSRNLIRNDDFINQSDATPLAYPTNDRFSSQSSNQVILDELTRKLIDWISRYRPA